jgi:hypothetical protein
MKIQKIILSSVVSLLAVVSADAQSTFQNLNFELGNPGPGSFNQNVPVANALPDWSAYYGNVQQTDVGYNVITTGATQISLVGGAQFHIDGNYSVLLQPGSSGASISQTSFVPSGSESLLFEATGSGPLVVSIGSQNLSFSAVGSGPSYTLYGANISAWAGDNETLTFSASAGGSSGGVTLDDISFSPNAVPEPTPFLLSGLAGLLFAAYRRFTSKRQ